MYIEEILKCGTIMVKVGNSILVGNITNWEMSPGPLGVRHNIALCISDDGSCIEITLDDLTKILRYNKEMDIGLGEIRDKIDFATRKIQ